MIYVTYNAYIIFILTNKNDRPWIWQRMKWVWERWVGGSEREKPGFNYHFIK